MNRKPNLLKTIATIYLLLLFSLLPCSHQFTHAEERSALKTIDLEPVDPKRERTVPLRIYLPTEKGKHPVILYSHGLGGSRTTKTYLGKQWSAAGFVCVFMQHAGSDSEVFKAAPLRQKFQTLKSAASVESALARVEDVSFVINQLELWAKDKEHPLFNRPNLEQLGMSGHSFGAVTTMMVAGRQLPFKKYFLEPRIDAFLAMSPQTGKGIPIGKAFGNLKKPIFCMTGTNDDSPIDPTVTPESRASVYGALPKGDKFMVVFDGGHHFTFSGGEGRMANKQNPKHHRAIETLTTKFWKAYLKNDEAAKTWLQSDKPRSENILDTADRWEWK